MLGMVAGLPSRVIIVIPIPRIHDTVWTVLLSWMGSVVLVLMQQITWISVGAVLGISLLWR